MFNPIITIITTVYNAQFTLENTIRSVLSQQNEIYEYWIIDGGSTDGSIDIIKKYENELAGWISEPDRGIYDAMNKGIDKAKGDWIYFLGADDLLIQNVLSEVVLYFKPNLSLVYGDVLFNTGHVMHSYIGIKSLLDNTIHHQGAFYHRTLFNTFRYNYKFSTYADYELTLRIFTQKKESLYIPLIISIFAVGGKSHKLVSTEINAIRKIYLRGSSLNAMLSLLLNIYYPYMTVRMKITRNLRKILNIPKKTSFHVNRR
jgi:putative colanic acid biosynthesis glycosyltransferase